MVYWFLKFKMLTHVILNIIRCYRQNKHDLITLIIQQRLCNRPIHVSIINMGVFRLGRISY